EAQRTQGEPNQQSQPAASDHSHHPVFVLLLRVLRVSVVPTTLGGVFQPQFVEVLFAVGRNVPSVGPEAKIDAPPVVRDARLVQLGDQLFEVQLSGAE